jgi:peptidoglycan/xylan/chitin deacetylase (PgdA/CDA1 family)
MFDLTLTFDNGPEPDITGAVLDTLARHGLKSTFFVLGHKLAQPERRRLAERAHAEGHWIGRPRSDRSRIHANSSARLAAAAIWTSVC